MRKMVGFRNVAVHDYQQLNLDIVRSIVVARLDPRLARPVAPADPSFDLDDGRSVGSGTVVGWLGELDPHPVATHLERPKDVRADLGRYPADPLGVLARMSSKRMRNLGPEVQR